MKTRKAEERKAKEKGEWNANERRKGRREETQEKKDVMKERKRGRKKYSY